jgi:EmrB/QacA subfamily drug resistance transporter
MSAAGRRSYQVTFWLLASAAIAYALMQSMVAPALPNLQAELHTTTTGAAWILTSFLLTASVVTPIAGRLGDMFGKKRTLVVVLAVLAVGTAVAAVATTIQVMILGRAIQGAGGAIFPLAFGIIRDEFPRERVAQGIAMISAILGIGAGFGIVLAGPITQSLSYHWLFWLPLVGVLASLAGVWLFVPESRLRSPGAVDWLGATLLSGWLVALLVPVSEGSTWGWTSPRTIGLFVLAAVLHAVWIFAETRIRNPLVDIGMMRLRPVWTTNLAALLIGFGMYSSFVLLPELVELPKSTGFGFGASVTGAGLFMLPATLAMLFAGPLAGRLSTTVGSRVPLILGALVSCVAFVLLAAAHGGSAAIYLGMFLMGTGIGLSFASMANLIVEAVPPEQTGVATGMNTIVRTIGGAVGSEVSAAIVAATVAAGSFPTDGGFTAAFAVCALALAAGAVASFAVPRPARAAGEVEPEPVLEAA